MDTFLVTLFVVLIELLAPANFLSQSFVTSSNNSLKDLLIDVTVDPVSCNAQVSIDLPVLGLVSCNLITVEKPHHYYKSWWTLDVLVVVRVYFYIAVGCAFCYIHLFHMD